MKSPAFTPFNEIGKKCLGRYGTLSFEYSAGRLFLSAYTRKREKSPVWRGHTQLSVSEPNLPIAEGGAPTKRTSLNVSTTKRIYWLPS